MTKTLTWDVVAEASPASIAHICRLCGIGRSTFYRYAKLQAPVELTLEKHVELLSHLSLDAQHIYVGQLARTMRNKFPHIVEVI